MPSASSEAVASAAKMDCRPRCRDCRAASWSPQGAGRARTAGAHGLDRRSHHVRFAKINRARALGEQLAPEAAAFLQDQEFGPGAVPLLRANATANIVHAAVWAGRSLLAIIHGRRQQQWELCLSARTLLVDQAVTAALQLNERLKTPRRSAECQFAKPICRTGTGYASGYT